MNQNHFGIGSWSFANTKTKSLSPPLNTPLTMAPLKFAGQLKRFDITIPRDKYETWEDLHKKLIGWCSHFSFQLEKG